LIAVPQFDDTLLPFQLIDVSIEWAFLLVLDLYLVVVVVALSPPPTTQQDLDHRVHIFRLDEDTLSLLNVLRDGSDHIGGCCLVNGVIETTLKGQC
jgi:hypothetical protein